MDVDLTPHSREWFAALEAINPQQAAHTRQIIANAGKEAVCTVCGDEPASDYRITTPNQAIDAVVSIRLCKDCRAIREMQGESFQPLDG
jgi:hypothetical protein